MNSFVVRTLTAVVFVVVMVCGIILDPALFSALFLFVSAIALREFYSITLCGRYLVQQKIGILTGGATYLVIAMHYFYGLSLAWLSISLVLMMLLAASVLFSNREDLVSLGLIYTGLLYVVLPFCVYPMLVTDGVVFDGTVLLSLFIIIWLSDAGAYCLGTLLGQKENSAKLAPSISPKKSWIGFWSGVAFAVAAAIGLHYMTWLNFSIVHCIAIGVIVSVGGVFGDLFESVWKRYFHVKDSGNCIPGHGGMLDRFDSSLVAIPLAAAYLILFNLI